MAANINSENAIMIGKLKLFNSIARETIIIADDELVNFDARFWRVANDDVKDRVIRLEDLEEKRQEKRKIEQTRLGVKKIMIPRKAKTNQEPISNVEMKESQAGDEMDSHELTKQSPVLPATKFSIPEFSHELKANRPPLRKYIRKEGMPGHQRIVIEVVEQKPKKISIASLKEKFGLSESKIGGIIRDAEKLGKVRRSQSGSYSWI